MIIVKVILNDENTSINKDPLFYNLMVYIDLKEQWERLAPYEAKKVHVTTYVTLPVLIDGVPELLSFKVIDYFNLWEVKNQQLIQYGYFEGAYDASRETQAWTKLWVYEVSSLI